MLKNCWTRIWFPSRISVLFLKRKTINGQIREERPEAMPSRTDEAIGQTSPGAAVWSLGPPTEPPGAGNPHFQSPMDPANTDRCCSLVNPKI